MKTKKLLKIIRVFGQEQNQMEHSQETIAETGVMAQIQIMAHGVLS